VVIVLLGQQILYYTIKGIDRI